MQSLWLVIIVFFLLILIMPIIAKIHASFDILNNMGTISLYIFFVKIFAYKVKIQNKKIVLIANNKTKEIEMELSDKQYRFLKQFNSQMKQKIVIKKINAYSRIGLSNAGTSAILTGLFNAFIGSILAYVKNIKKSAQICVKSEPDYNGEHLVFAIYGSFTVTILDLIYAIIMSFIITKRSEKYERI